MAYAQNPYYYPQYSQTGAAPGLMEAYKQPYQPQQMPPPMQAAQMPMQAQPTPQAGSPMQWVQGEAAAKAWTVAPNSSVVLWDTEERLIYIKSADQMGMPQIRTLRWEEYHPAPPQAQSTASGNYATMETVRELENRIAALTEKLNELMKTEESQNGKQPV